MADSPENPACTGPCRKKKPLPEMTFDKWRKENSNVSYESQQELELTGLDEAPQDKIVEIVEVEYEYIFSTVTNLSE